MLYVNLWKIFAIKLFIQIISIMTNTIYILTIYMHKVLKSATLIGRLYWSSYFMHVWVYSLIVQVTLLYCISRCIRFPYMAQSYFVYLQCPSSKCIFEREGEGVQTGYTMCRVIFRSLHGYEPFKLCEAHDFDQAFNVMIKQIDPFVLHILYYSNYAVLVELRGKPLPTVLISLISPMVIFIISGPIRKEEEICRIMPMSTQAKSAIS